MILIQCYGDNICLGMKQYMSNVYKMILRLCRNFSSLQYQLFILAFVMLLSSFFFFILHFSIYLFSCDLMYLEESIIIEIRDYMCMKSFFFSPFFHHFFIAKIIDTLRSNFIRIPDIYAVFQNGYKWERSLR